MDKRQDEVVMDNIQTSEFQVEESEIVEHKVDIVTTYCKPCSLKVSDECKICKYCKDKPKYGGQNRLKQKCVTRICIKKRKKDMGASSMNTTSQQELPSTPKRVRL